MTHPRSLPPPPPPPPPPTTPRTNGAAVVGLITGVFAIPVAFAAPDAGFWVGLLALVMSGYGRMVRFPKVGVGHSAAVAGLLLGLIAVGISVVTVGSDSRDYYERQFERSTGVPLEADL